jgi:hypothetical protein
MQSQLSEQTKSKKTAKPRATAIANGKSIAAAPKAAKKTARAPKAPAKQAH